MNTSTRLSIIFLLISGSSQLLSQNIIRDIKVYHESRSPLQIREYEETENRVELKRIIQLYLNGKKKKEHHYSGGTLNGQTSTWYPNGQKKTLLHYTNGKRDGIWSMWFKNGTKWFEGYHKDGKKTATWTSWTRDGKKLGEKLYQDGKLAEKKKFD